MSQGIRGPKERGREGESASGWGSQNTHTHSGDFPGSQMIKTLPFNAGTVGLIPGQAV